MTDRSVLILGTNSKKYLNFAINCAKSIKIHNPDLKIFIVTNIKNNNKEYEGINFLPIEDSLAKLYIETKLYLDKFLQTAETLYIDSDMLCFGNLNPVFDLCNSMDVTVFGQILSVEQYWGPEYADFAIHEFKINNSILFNGGFYYIKKSTLTNKIYSEARKISSKYDEYGFQRIQNNWKNEEDLMSIAMVSNNQLPINDGGLSVAGFSAINENFDMNVLTGKIQPSKFKKTEILSHINKPLLFHFGGQNMNSELYFTQKNLLKLSSFGLSNSIATLLTKLTITIPYKLVFLLKRPIKIIRNKFLKLSK